MPNWQRCNPGRKCELLLLLIKFVRRQFCISIQCVLVSLSLSLSSFFTFFPLQSAPFFPFEYFPQYLLVPISFHVPRSLTKAICVTLSLEQTHHRSLAHSPMGTQLNNMSSIGHQSEKVSFCVEKNMCAFAEDTCACPVPIHQIQAPIRSRLCL